MKSINIKFPIEDDSVGNSFFKMNKTTKEAITSNMLFYFFTRRKTRYYRKDFGTNLLDFIFNPGDAITESDVVQSIKEVSRYVPNVHVNNVKFNWVDNDGVNEIGGTQLNLVIGFKYSEDTFNYSGELELNF